MPPSTITNRFYPRLSEVITVDDLPESLSFVQDGLDDLLDSVHYKNLQFSKSIRGDSAFYSLDIVAKNIGLDLPFGLRFVLNPDTDGDTTISSFPITLQYQWGILGFLRSVDLGNFAFTPEAFYELGLELFNITDEQVLANAFNFFITPTDITANKYQLFIDDVNSIYPSANLTIPTGQTPTIASITALIRQNTHIPVGMAALIFEAYLLDGDLATTKSRVQQFYTAIVPNGIEDYILDLIKPKVRASLTLSAGIEFPNNVLKPVTADGTPIPDTKTLFKFAEATFYVDTETGIGSQLSLAGSLIPEYSEIGNTGLIISFTNAKLDLSTTSNIPEADAAGYPVDFVGLYLQDTSISFTKFGTDDTTKTSVGIKAENFLIGTGGVSGKISLESNGVLYRKFNDFAVELDEFALTFRQNAIIDSSISGKLTLNRFTQNGQPAVINIQASIKDNGDFNISATPSPDLIKITLPGVFDFHLRSFSIGKTERGYYLSVAGQLDFIADIPLLGEVLPKGIEIDKLLIWDNGDLEFEHGSIPVRKSFSLHVGPVNLEVNNMSLGAYTRKLNGVDRSYSYFGFDGMINTGSAGINASGNGIKYYFTTDDSDTKPFDQFLSIDRIAIDLKIPGSASADSALFVLKGFLSMHNPNNEGTNAGVEYTGAVTFSIPRLKLSGSAGMRMQPGVPSFIVDAGLELSTPIPLGATGLGIYGFRGLFGHHYKPAKSATTPPLAETASWWDYYKVHSTITQHEGIEIDKFSNEPGYSIGAGLSIATDFDSGLIFSSKLFLLLYVPDVFLIQGQAGILRERIGLADEDDPPFSAFISITDQGFAARFGIDYNIPSDGSLKGDILALNGTLDMAFFFNNASGWYINVGKDQPESERVQAKILTLFQGYAYLMISSQGVKAGAGAKFDFNKKFGPAAVGIGAYLDMSGFLSFKPIQIGARIEFGGYAFVKVFFVKLGISVRIYLAVEAPHPFNIAGGLEVKVRLLFKSIKVNIDVSWHFNDDKSPLLAPIAILGLPDADTKYIPAIATNILSGETFQLNYVTTEDSDNIPAPGTSGWAYNFTNTTDAPLVTIPLDSFIDIELLKPVKPGDVPLGGGSSQLPDDYQELLPPQKGIIDQVSHQFELTGLEISSWSGTEWKAYDVYEAVTAIVLANTADGNIDLSKLKPGYWQFAEPDKYNKIRLLSQNMFSYLSGSDTATTDLDAKNFQNTAMFCYDELLQNTIVNFKKETTGTVYQDNETFYVGGLQWLVNGIPGTVKNDGAIGNSLYLSGQSGSFLVKFPKPVSLVKLDFGSNQNNLKVDFIQTVYLPRPFLSTIAVEETKEEQWVSAGQQNASLTYDHSGVPIDFVRVTINPGLKSDYNGNLVIGGHVELPAAYYSQLDHAVEVDKALAFVTLFGKSFTAAEVLNWNYPTGPGIAGQWVLNGTGDTSGSLNGILSGSPDSIGGFYGISGSDTQLSGIYKFSGNDDALIVPFRPALKVENLSFSIGAIAVFNPFTAGISTLLSRIQEDPDTGYKKGYAVHLVQNHPGGLTTVYSTAPAVPTFAIRFTCYDKLTSTSLEANAPYTLDCDTGLLSSAQYKSILISVNRTTQKLDMYVDKQSKLSVAIPAELAVVSYADTATYFHQLTYQSMELGQRLVDNPITKDNFIDEVKIIEDGLFRTEQPVWRPNTTFAVKVKTQDRVDGTVPAGSERTHIFGFKTAGPIGHFHQQNPAYQALALADRADEFKLASLKYYIDYERSFPDAQGRYDISKPVFYHDPQVKLYFTQPYINAMYADWAVYQEMSAVKSALELSLIDAAGVSLKPAIIWDVPQEITITDDNYTTLPADQQTLYLMNKMSAANQCQKFVNPIKKRLKQGSYHFTDLKPYQLYTALFNAVYQPEGAEVQVAEVHKFAFITSRYPTFQAQASSFIPDGATNQSAYAIKAKRVNFSDDEINSRLKTLINDDTSDDPADVLQYAVKFDRLVYGGLGIGSEETADNSIITLFVNTKPGSSSHTILGVLVTNPEPFNEPRLDTALLADTVNLKLYTGSAVNPDPDLFIYIHSRNTSSVFITNSAMNIPARKMELNFRQKLFNGMDYTTLHEDYTSPKIDLASFII